MFPVVNTFQMHSLLRDCEEIPQVLFVFPSEKGGRGLRPAGNTKPEEKLEENGWRGGGDG